MGYEHIRCDLDGSFMIVTLNRPDKLNAYTGLMGAEIADAFERADADDAVRAVIVTGAGRGFCAGADVSGGAKSFDTSGSHGAGVFASSGSRSGRFVEAIFNCRKPSIAAINGAGGRRRHHHDAADGHSHRGQGRKNRLHLCPPRPRPGSGQRLVPAKTGRAAAGAALVPVGADFRGG